MNKISQKLEKLAKIVIFISKDITWSEKLEAYNKALDIIVYIKNSKQIEDKEWITLRKLTDELIKDNSKPINIKSYKRNHIDDLKVKIINEMKTVPYIKEEPIKITSIDDWIKELKIFKLKNEFLSMDYYKTNYELYCDIRKIVLTRSSSKYKIIYLSRVVDKLESDESKSLLPQNIDLKIENYELTQLIKLIKSNSDFNLTKHTYQDLVINNRFEHSEYNNKILLMTRK